MSTQNICLYKEIRFGYFLFWFQGLDFGSDCTSSWSLHSFLLLMVYKYE